MKLVTYNIRYSLGQGGHYDLTRIAHAVEGADVLECPLVMQWTAPIQRHRNDRSWLGADVKDPTL